MKKSVGLLILTDLPRLGRVAILQRRGEFNHKTMKAETYPGGCQVTCHGEVEEGEDVSFALLRKLDEELEKEAEDALSREMLRSEHYDPNHIFFPEASRLETEGQTKTAITYTATLPPDVLRVIKLSPSTGGLRLLREHEVPLIQNLLSFDEREGVTDRRVVAMFPDEKAAVQRAFEIFE